ncbi:MAG: hypothetical protein RSE13_16485 [Planktothrix sp. GU0601_MAG3]|nr:MAG: hypothetical protein RSE13_16485 [Planktothrix sp. GU0601_MAG3]
MLREKLKQELDKLNEDQLKKVANFISLMESQSSKVTSSLVPLWQKATPTQRAREFRDWISQLPKTSVSLPDEAFSRECIYEDD